MTLRSLMSTEGGLPGGETRRTKHLASRWIDSLLAKDGPEANEVDREDGGVLAADAGPTAVANGDGVSFVPVDQAVKAVHGGSSC